MAEVSKRDLRSATGGRRRMAYVAAFLYFLATVFLLLVNIGQVSNVRELNDWYFFRFDVSNVVPAAVPEAAIVNTIATTIGLHDFYDIGMWNYCEGYFAEGGVTDCTKAQFLFWFNPVDVLQSQLLRGATIKLPDEVTGYLNILRLASQVMFGCFFAGVIASFFAMILAPLATYSRIWTILLAVFGTLTTLATVLGACISTGMWSIFQSKLQQAAAEVNIVPTLGVKMFAFQWVAAGTALLAVLIQMGLICCGTSRRDIETGRRTSRALSEKGGD